MIEAELFGAEKGAYTGSVNRTDGKFQLADRGTLLLDEVGDMSLKVQAKVLRVLQEGEFERLGGNETVKVDVRVITATNKDLDEEVKNGSFRDDLLYRLNVIPIHVPPLRQRREDIPDFVGYFIERYCEANDLRTKHVDADVIQQLQRYDWPGNIRELQNLCERLVIMTTGDTIGECDIPSHILRPRGLFSPSLSGDLTLKQVKQNLERDYIVWHLQKADWNISKTARQLGIERTNLHKKITQYRISRQDKSE